jgi:hypothetical protein
MEELRARAQPQDASGIPTITTPQIRVYSKRRIKYLRRTTADVGFLAAAGFWRVSRPPLRVCRSLARHDVLTDHRDVVGVVINKSQLGGIAHRDRNAERSALTGVDVELADELT